MMADDEVLGVLTQDQWAELLMDAQATKSELLRRGWASDDLIELQADGPDIDIKLTVDCGPVCMTGAVGAALEGVDFLDWAVHNASDIPVDWDWSPRAWRLICALIEFRFDDTRLYGEGPVDQIVNINDKQLSRQDEAVAWLDNVISEAAKMLASFASQEYRKQLVREQPRQKTQEDEVLA